MSSNAATLLLLEEDEDVPETQYLPAGQGPEQIAEVSPGASPYVPAGHGMETPSWQYIPAGHTACFKKKHAETGKRRAV